MPNKNHALVALFALTAIGIGSLCISVFANEQQQQRTIMNDPRRGMITTLEARGPHPSIGDQAQTFDRFVGTWDCDYASFKEDGTTEHAKGEVIFGWVLDGRAVQDIWTWIDKDTSGERKLGTTVRFFDPKIGKWRTPRLLGQSCKDRGAIDSSFLSVDLEETRWSCYLHCRTEPFGHGFGAGVDINLAQGRVPGIDEPVRCPGGDDDDIARLHFALLIAGHASSLSLLHDNDFIVVVPVQFGPASWRRVHQKKGNVYPMFLPDKFMRHVDKR
jgi:hypothetical protein